MRLTCLVCLSSMRQLWDWDWSVRFDVTMTPTNSTSSQTMNCHCLISILFMVIIENYTKHYMFTNLDLQTENPPKQMKFSALTLVFSLTSGPCDVQNAQVSHHACKELALSQCITHIIIRCTFCNEDNHDTPMVSLILLSYNYIPCKHHGFSVGPMKNAFRYLSLLGQ